ncbi:acyl-CoA mutase large subunit family protein [Paenibacillus sp.]|uniref:acyl-CoA mutase large subunit family protein n=1 Tax=Paenibacillus sp. TaxID=58172 RepID=UPI002D339E0D|nr:methylmalonyl-CoA mutase family protein [Paenibacillus sp.]HZG87663.1 methylmalonyl-CoA mutase family protein [Paenibacillus sp.]
MDPREPTNERPGTYPYTRGIYPRMYREKLWTMRQYAGFGTARETNRRLKRLLAQGQTGLSVAFDLPTQLGLDPDDARAAGEVGKTGVSAATLADWDAVLRGIPLGETSLSMTANATAPALFAFTAALASRRGVPPASLRGTVQNDMLKEYAARNLYVLPPEPSVRMAVDAIEFGCRHYPRWHPVSVSGYHMREAGADAAQEIGLAIANGLAYAEAAARRGIPVDETLPRFSFFFAAGTDLLEEAAKFRAARRLWAKLARERLGAARPESWRMKFHAQTAGSALAASQTDNNVVRVTLQALAAVLGGAQSLHTNAKDEALRLPTAASAALALRTQHILAYESGVAERIDPLAGSYEVEAATDRLEREAHEWVKAIDRVGGALRAVESGFVQRAIRESAYREYRRIESGERQIVGVNRFADGEPASVRAAFPRAASSGAEERRAIEAVRRHREARSEADARRAVDALAAAAERGRSVMPAMIDCANAGCTIGEMYGALAALFGEYREPPEGAFEEKEELG